MKTFLESGEHRCVDKNTDQFLLDESIRGYTKRMIASAIMKMVYEFQILPKCSATAQALGLLTFGIQSDWRDIDLFQVLNEGLAQAHFFGNSEFYWKMSFRSLVDAIRYYHRGEDNRAYCQAGYACRDADEGYLRPNNMELAKERIWNLPGGDTSFSSPRRVCEKISVHRFDIFPMIKKDFPPYHEWPHFP